MATRGTTGTGLDQVVDLIYADYGLNNRISGLAIREGATAANGMNALIIQAIRATGVANDGNISTADVYDLNLYIRKYSLDAWTALHGDDEGMVETGFHRVQGDGDTSRLFGENAVDTILDGIFHLGFLIKDGHFQNEDGDANACVDDVAFWLNDLLRADLASGALANLSVDRQVHGSTGTGLDHIVELISDDFGLNDTVSGRQIREGATAANGMNQILVEGIRATGIADDGDIDEIDLHDLNAWIQDHRAVEWTTLHGDDEDGVETGFHLVQSDGGRAFIFGEEGINTVADGLYHIGFDIQWGRFVNEDGNGNATLTDVADWLSLLLHDDLQSGELSSGHAPVDTDALKSDRAYVLKKVVTVDGGTGEAEVGHRGSLKQTDGAITFSFASNDPEGYHALFSKDGASNKMGDVTAYIADGRLIVQVQDGAEQYWIDAGDHRIEAGRTYDFALSFGKDGLQLYLNGDKVGSDYDITIGLDQNKRALLVGAAGWGRDSSNPHAAWNQFDGTISEFTLYDRALDRFEVAALAKQGPLGGVETGPPAVAGAQAAVLAGSGLMGTVFDRTGMFNSIDDLIAQAATQTTPNFRFTAESINFGGFGESRTLGNFLDQEATLQGGGGNTAMTTIGMRIQGFIWLEAGDHRITVRSDDGFLLKIGGEVVSSYEWGRGFDATTETVSLSGGLYAIDLYYFQNNGGDGLRLEIDGATAGPELFFQTVEDYQAALAAHGEMPAGGLDIPYDGPVGTTGTELDRLVEIIGTDEGLAHRNSAGQIAAGAAAADAINHMIVEALEATGAWEDGKLTVSEVYDISDYIRANHYDAFLAAHGDDENGKETGFHLIQGDGGTSFLFGEDAVNTVLDGIYHIGFDTVWDRFANEDGNANARVETVTYWLNEILSGRIGTMVSAPIIAPIAGSSMVDAAGSGWLV